VTRERCTAGDYNKYILYTDDFHISSRTQSIDRRFMRTILLLLLCISLGVFETIVLPLHNSNTIIYARDFVPTEVGGFSKRNDGQVYSSSVILIKSDNQEIQSPRFRFMKTSRNLQ